MLLKRLSLKDFRNYESLCWEDISPDINLLVGRNAQGKTNLIEAMGFLSFAKSFRGAREIQLIRRGCTRAILDAEYSVRSHNGRLEVALLGEAQRAIRINGVPIRRVSELIGIFNTVVFSPEDLKTLKESPGLRRKLLDTELSKLRPSYYLTLQEYYYIVKSKNKLLKNRTPDTALLDTYDDALVSKAVEIMNAREWFVRLLDADSARFNDIFSHEKLSLKYKPCVSTIDEYEIRSKLKASRASELRMGMSLVGPHREDMEININEKDARIYASQGQQRTAILSIKLACGEIARKLLGERPVLLLDDVFSELDAERRCRLFSVIEGYQTFITSTEKVDCKGAVFVIESAKIIG